MALYKHSPQGEVLLALQSENPRLTGEVTDFTFSAPVQVSGVSTTGKIRGIPGKGFSGANVFTYNRLNFTTMMSGVNTRIQLFTLPNDNLNDVVAEVNNLYGLNLLPSEFGSSAMSANTTSSNWTMTPVNSHQYIGSWGITWYRGDKQLRDFFPVRTLGHIGDLLPMLKTHVTNFDDIGQLLTDIADGMVLTADSAPLSAMVSAIADKTGVPFVISAGTTPTANTLDLTGYTARHRRAATVKDAAPGYLYILELTPSPLPGGYCAPLYLHYGKVQLHDISADISTVLLAGFTPSDIT